MTAADGLVEALRLAADAMRAEQERDTAYAAIRDLLGAIPGIGGRVGIVLAIPFVFNLDLVSGAVFLVAMHAVVHTGGAIPAILIGVPGSGSDAATVCDGFPMTQNGEAGRALGASLAAARDSAYTAVSQIHFENAHFRRDIAAKGLRS